MRATAARTPRSQRAQARPRTRDSRSRAVSGAPEIALAELLGHRRSAVSGHQRCGWSPFDPSLRHAPISPLVARAEHSSRDGQPGPLTKATIAG